MLRDAVDNSKLNTIRCLVESGADVNATGPDQISLLMLAVEKISMDVVRLLVRWGADVNVANATKETPLLLAAQYHDWGVVHFMIGSGADVSVADEYGQTVLSYAVATNTISLDTVRLLVESGADINAADTHGHFPLFYGAQFSNFDAVRYLVESGSDVNALNGDNTTPLMTAARKGGLEVVQFLIDAGADVNATDSAGLTALMKAAVEGAFDAVQYLAQHGADVSAVDKNEATMLMLTAKGGSLDAVRFVFKSPTDAKAVDKDGWTALMHAVRSDSLDAVRFLLENGADVNTANNDGKTAAYIASSCGHSEIQQLLLQFKPHVYKAAEKTFSQTPATFFISPFEVKLRQFVQGGNVGGTYRAKWLDADVAVKLFVPDAGVTTFADEVAAWHQLRHPNVIKLYGACDVGHHFFVCEWASNGSLVEYLRECEKSGKYRTPWKFLHGAALGLAYLHERKIVHGNLCSNSILIGSDGLTKLADFRVSGSMKDGTSGYSSARWQSPEQLRGEEASFPSDIYSFCLCAVEAVTGEVLWEGYSDSLCEHFKAQWSADYDFYSPVQSGLSTDLRTLVPKMCGDDPSTRVSASAVVQMLERLAAHEVEGQQRVQSTPEPLAHVNDYRDGGLSHQWQKLRALISSAELGQVQHAVVHELETLNESLGNANRPLKVLDQFYWVLNKTGSFDSRPLELRAATVPLRIDALTPFGLRSTLTVLDKLETEDERSAFVAILKREIDHHGSAYSEGQLAVLKKAYTDITTDHKSDAVVPTPKWFLPRYELEFDGANYLAEGALGTVYRAKWLESDVVVKQLKRTKSNNEEEDGSLLLASTPETDSKRQARKEARERFEREVKVWFGLSHPHVVRLFGACHVGNPFFACEYAGNGSLDKYLRKYPDEIWQKLHEAALGVQYLHSRGHIHCDLKCNNIVVGSDHKAKVTDFGLSSATVVTGAWRWVAPECLKGGASAQSLASDIYAFGMCIVEALRIVEIATTKDNRNCGTPLPWGNLDNNVVKYRVTVLN